ncbi:uncharacterized protein [Rutidosis leptorrhynchoides]|uniref:uncharacterized protein n=1 Tax=Rutidosis leptorrhynchoides TaxID=125765 RepID=UPI003A995809
MDVRHLVKKQKMNVRVRQLNILEDLPQDMLVEILSRVGLNSSAQLFMVKSVCKAFEKHFEDALVYKRAYFDSIYPDIGLRLLEKASNMQLKEAFYVYGLVMFASHQIEEKDIGLQIINQTFPPVPNLVVEVRTMIFDLLRRLWVLFNPHPFDDVATCCTIKGHNGYFPLDLRCAIILTKP